MSKISFEKDALVFYKNEQYKVINTISFSKVTIKHIDNQKLLTVNISELSSKPYSKLKKEYFDTYDDEEWEIARKRYSIIEDLLYKRNTKEKVKKIADENKKAISTIYNWIKLYENTGEISSLIPNVSGKGNRNSRLDNTVEHIIKEVIDELYLNEQRSGFGKIYNKIQRECKRLGFKAPHENTIRDRIRAIDPKKALKSRHGYKASKDKYTNHENEYKEGTYPLDVIQIDHTPLDIIVVDEVNREPLKRPFITVAIDVYSRMIAGFYVSLNNPSFYSVGQCLLSVFKPKEEFLKKYDVFGEWNIFGVPRICHVDNGSDLVSSDMQRVCESYKISLMKRPIGRPEFGAHVERVLGTINKEVHNLSGTTFSNIFEKGKYNSQKKAMFTLYELTQWLTHYIVNIYHKTYHHGIGDTPSNRYEKGIFGDENNPGTGILPPIIDNYDDIEITLLPTFYRTVQRNGITIDGITYYSDVLRHWINATNDRGEKIKHKIKRDPLNIQKIYFYDNELKNYFEVPYRKISAPVMTLWDLKAAKRHLKEKNIKNYNEDDIFAAHDKLEEIENDVKQKHKSYKSNKRISKKTMEKKVEIDNSPTDLLFDEIDLFEVRS